MKNIIYLLLLLIVASSCNRTPKDDGFSPPPLYPEPQTVEVNTKDGYKVNAVTGDSIKSLINSLGDTIKSGVSIPLKGKLIHSDSIAKPKEAKTSALKSLEKYNAHLNLHKIPENIPTIPIDKSQLKTIKFGEGNLDFVLIGETGDTIPTGVPILAKGKVVKAIQPKPIKALPPAFNDVAITNIQYLDVDQGMNSSYIYSVMEDKRGNIWFGTLGGGVSMYNGETFSHFTQEEGLSDKIVLSIMEDKRGNIWFGTWFGGVSMYNGETFRHFTQKEGLSNNSVWSILEDKSGNLWFGTKGGGVSMYNGETFRHFTEKEGLSNNTVWSILEDKRGNLWFGTDGGGVSMYNGKIFKHFTEKEGLSNNTVWSILEDKRGNLWFGTWGGGVSMYNGKTFRHFTEKEGLSNNIVWSILEDKSGNLWFGTKGGGVSMYNGKTFRHFTEKEGLSNNSILSIMEDKRGNLWFGTWGGGVSTYNRKTFMHFTQKEGLSNNSVYSILEDKRGNLWFGTDGGGVSMYNGETFRHLTEKEGLSNNSVWSILEDKSGNLWFGTRGGGLDMYNGETFRHFTQKEGLSNDVILSSLEDKSGNLWFWFGAWGGGVDMYNGETFRHFTQKEGLSNNSVWSIMEDKRGNLWFGTWGGGVSKYDENSFTHYTDKEGLSNNYVTSILEDKSGNLWFGTSGGGVNIYNGETFLHFTQKEGLSNNIVTSILEDQNGNIWVGTDKGLNLMLHNKNEKVNTSSATFTKQDGLKGLDFISNSAFIDSKNRAWWGTGKGLTMLDLNNFQLPQNPPTVYLKQLDINEQFIDYRNISDSLTKEMQFLGVERFENYPLNLKLPYDKNHLTFHFVGIDWAAPHKIQYSYRMLGLNDNWSNPSKEAKAEYRNLSYGTYTFQIRAIGESGKWSEPFEYTFTISPPWWHTWWARALYALFALTLLLTLYKWRTAALIKRQKELEKTVEERTAEVVEEKKVVEQQKHLIEEKHKEITDSINYAERIQRSFLASKELLDENLNDYFVFFQPKDVVSGDFYWASELNNGNFVFSCADSTGHGVPGAIMSIANIACLKEAVTKGLQKPDEILNETRKLVIEYLKNDGSLEGGKDGMDCSLLVLDKERKQLHIAAANNSVFIVRNQELLEFKPDKMPVGKHDKDQISFTLQTTQLQKGDVMYTLTDGFSDQFGGEKGKKYMIKSLKEMLLQIAHLPMLEQEQKLADEFDKWKGENEQVDDVCIIGVRI